MEQHLRLPMGKILLVKPQKLGLRHLLSVPCATRRAKAKQERHTQH
jgi:hypothetical protein